MKLPKILICLFFAVITFFTVSAVSDARTADDTEAAVERQGFQLTLVGTAVADDPMDSVAVIESGIDGKQRSYHEGELAGEVLIIEILRNLVIVETEQGESFISLSRPLQEGAARPGASQSPVQAVFGGRPQNNLRNQTLYLDGKVLTAELADFDDKIKEVNVDAVSVYGKSAGIRIYPVEPDSIFSKIGLKNGDVIKEVNGMEITRPEQATAVFKKLQAGDDVDIKVKGRRTRRIHLIIE
jgi:general secretion pathway protein C